MKAIVLVFVACVIGAVVAQKHKRTTTKPPPPPPECYKDSDCSPCGYPGKPHCHSDGLCYCGEPTECKTNRDCKNVRCKDNRPSVCKKDGIHYHCLCHSTRKGGKSG